MEDGGSPSAAINKESLKNMRPDLAPTAATFAIPNIRVVCFACTASSFLIGMDRVDEELRSGLRNGGFYSEADHEDQNSPAAAKNEVLCIPPRDVDVEIRSSPLPQTTSLSRGVLCALERVLWDGPSASAPSNSNFGAEISEKRIVVLTPYLSEINAEQIPLFEGHFDGSPRVGNRRIKILEICGMGIADDADIGRCSHDTIRNQAVDLFERHNIRTAPGGAGESPACVFISCSGMRSIEVVRELEQRLNVPVLCSNGCMLWHVCRMVGYGGELPIIGRLGKL